MIPENVKRVIEKLILKTKSGETIWNKSSASNGYKIDLTSAVISVSMWTDNYSQDMFYYLTILNDRGETIENITCEEKDIDYNVLKSLYDTVNRKYLKVDETLNNLLNEIDGTKTIGIEIKQEYNNPSSELGDDLPF